MLITDLKSINQNLKRKKFTSRIINKNLSWYKWNKDSIMLINICNLKYHYPHRYHSKISEYPRNYYVVECALLFTFMPNMELLHNYYWPPPNAKMKKAEDGRVYPTNDLFHFQKYFHQPETDYLFEGLWKLNKRGKDFEETCRKLEEILMSEGLGWFDYIKDYNNALTETEKSVETSHKHSFRPYWKYQIARYLSEKLKDKKRSDKYSDLMAKSIEEDYENFFD